MSDFYYITRYAISGRVLVVPKSEASIYADGKGLRYKSGGYDQYIHHGEFCDSKDEAERRVAAMKDKKRQSIEKQLERIKKPVKFVYLK